VEPGAVSRLRIGISTCPNDTFAFHGLLAGQVSLTGLKVPADEGIEWLLDDVEALNRAAHAGQLAVAKLSFATLLELPRDWVVLRAGAALGFGVGPVVLRRRGAQTPPDPLVLVPGSGTTAALLWRSFHPEHQRLEVRRFDQIMPALEAGTADLGVCIHEGRFTYAERGLELVEDLGSTWEQVTGLPLPLGGIAARAELGPERIQALDAALRQSIDLAQHDPAACLPTMRRYATELEDWALFKHVELYVNADTRLLSARAEAAIQALARRSGHAPLRILPPAADGAATGQ
jgi:1,4-dihydroxy-6-naphthoate synthase